MPSVFKLILTLLAVIAAWLLLAASTPDDLLSASWSDVPRHPGAPLRLTLLVESLAPPSLEVQPPCRHLVAAHRPSVRLHGISFKGPVWRAVLVFYPVSLEATQDAQISVLGKTLSLPTIAPVLPDGLPQSPRRMAARPAPAASPACPLLAAVGAALLLASALAILLKRRRQSPARRIRRLPPVAESLDALPSILAAAQPPVTPASRPEFFMDLDLARFAPRPPDDATVEALLSQALSLLSTPR